jgi:hypothetical protein
MYRNHTVALTYFDLVAWDKMMFYIEEKDLLRIF